MSLSLFHVTSVKVPCPNRIEVTTAVRGAMKLAVTVQLSAAVENQERE